VDEDRVRAWGDASQQGKKHFKEREILEMLSRSGLTTEQLKEYLASEIERRKKREKGDEGA